MYTNFKISFYINFSLFSLSFQSYNIAQYTEYLIDHPEIKQLIADYTQILLIGNNSFIE